MTEPTHASGRRIVIIGSAGRLGSALVDRLEEHCELTCLNRQRMDLSNARQIFDVLDPLEFEYLIFAAGLTAVDYCEKHQDEAYELNADVPGMVAEICAGKGAHMTFFSTDFVFDGRGAAPYSERDTPNPLNVYGASKREGERQVLEASPEHLVVRLSWLFGFCKPAFPEWIIQQAQQHDTLSLPEDKTASPSCCEDLAAYLQVALGLGTPAGLPASGLMHLCNSEVCSWQEWGQFCLDAAARAGVSLRTTRVSATRLAEVESFVAARPAHSALCTARFTQSTRVAPRSWREAMADHFARTLACYPDPCEVGPASRNIWR